MSFWELLSMQIGNLVSSDKERRRSEERLHDKEQLRDKERLRDKESIELDLLTRGRICLDAHDNAIAYSITSSIAFSMAFSTICKQDYKGDWSKLGLLGSGAFAKVYLGLNRASGQRAALKCYKKRQLLQDSRMRVRLEREVKLMQKLSHRNILKLYGVTETPKQVVLILEHVEGEELFDYVLRKDKLPVKEALRLMMQMVDAVQYCHGLGIVHRDIKLENFLIDAAGKIKLIDFGLATRVEEGVRLKSRCGSPHYVSPEIASSSVNNGYDGRMADVWSLGVVLFAMVYGSLPFVHHHSATLLGLVTQARYQFPSDDSVGKDVVDLISQMMCKDVAKRIPLQQVLSHRAFLGIIPAVRFRSFRVKPKCKHLTYPRDRFQRIEQDLSRLRLASHNIDSKQQKEGLPVSPMVSPIVSPIVPPIVPPMVSPIVPPIDLPCSPSSPSFCKSVAFNKKQKKQKKHDSLARSLSCVA